jgi:phosphotransferase system HPr (HPr) family protein
MTKRDLTILNESGMHARPAAEFVSVARRFKAQITLCRSDEPDDKVDAKSILSVLALGLSAGTRVTLECIGRDEARAVATLSAMLGAEETR